MSSESVPLRSEVIEWGPRSLADYMKRLRLSGCDKVVMKGGINGARFLKMTESDLQKFPTIHIPIISRICTEINNSEARRGVGHRSREPKYPPQSFIQEDKAWDSDEFDNSDNDDDYEHPTEPIEEDSYVCALEAGAGERGEGGEESEDEYESPPSADTEEIPRILSLAKPLGNNNYIGSLHGGASAKPPVAAERCRTARPPQLPGPQRSAAARNNLPRLPLPRLDGSPQRLLMTPSKPPSRPAFPQVDRSRKPGQPRPPMTNPALSRDGNPLSSALLPVVRPPQLKAPVPPDPRPSSGRHTPQSPSTPKNPTPQGMDPRWYGGQVTRAMAEASLRQVNKDGAFLVRDSSRGSSDQPYTLMVLYQGKVFNIQIRHRDNMYCLGKGLMGIQSFPAVTEMIAHHIQTPLLLIDAMDRGSASQRQCCLLHPAGL